MIDVFCSVRGTKVEREITEVFPAGFAAVVSVVASVVLVTASVAFIAPKVDINVGLLVTVGPIVEGAGTEMVVIVLVVSLEDVICLVDM